MPDSKEYILALPSSLQDIDATKDECEFFTLLKKSLLEKLNQSGKPEPDGFDLLLFRFSRKTIQTSGDIADAEKQVLEHLEWRKEKSKVLEAAKRDTIRGKICTIHDNGADEYYIQPLLIELLPISFKGFTGYDHDGDPVWVVRPGNLDTDSIRSVFLDKIGEEGIKDALIYNFTRFVEALKLETIRQNRCVHFANYVIDVGGLGIHHLTDTFALRMMSYTTSMGCKECMF